MTDIEANIEILKLNRLILDQLDKDNRDELKQLDILFKESGGYEHHLRDGTVTAIPNHRNYAKNLIKTCSSILVKELDLGYSEDELTDVLFRKLRLK